MNGKWQPIVGEETLRLFEKLGLDQDGIDIVSEEAISILSKCIPPYTESGQETGLVVGYIQSGKTLSFTTVAALACDNEFPIIIVIAGTSIPLTDQSKKRLRDDLRLDVRKDRKWRHFHNPQSHNNDNFSISRILTEWQDESVPQSECQTILITVMKQHNHLNHLINVLRNVNLQNIPILLIDDEADQAGLNNLINEGEESTTYQCLRTLKDIIPHHTFLQYTATPQGPLLINLIDVLSPGFAVVLTPGDHYVGGNIFFTQNELIEDIPAGDIPTRNSNLFEPPESLMHALRCFFVGVAIGWIRNGGDGNRTMMIHPSRRTVGHSQYHTWVTSIIDNWLQILQDTKSSDYGDLLDDFRSSYDELGATIDNLESFELVVEYLKRAIRRTELHLVNSQRGRTPQIDWKGAYSHILVGGQALDRGFTVEGLTVTYMPRGVGARRADTIQQRARFFGYKGAYLGFCRVFLEQEVSYAFRRYVEHEEDIRKRLADNERSGRPLSELRRAFLLTRNLYPTRDSIIDVDFVRANFNEGWYFPRAPHDSYDYVINNLRMINEFLAKFTLITDEGNDNRTEMQRHNVIENIFLRNVYEDLLVNLQFSRLNDAQNFLGVMVIIQNLLNESPDAECSLYQMSCGKNRKRNLNALSEIPNLFQGAHPVNPPEKRGSIYAGDRLIRSSNGITIQIHYLNIPEFVEKFPQQSTVPNIAIWIPRNIAGDVFIQDQGELIDFNE